MFKVKENYENKIKGALYGFAIGDAMGATTEFMNSESIKRKYGKVTDIIGGGWLNLNHGEVTDDTQMTMCVLKALEKFTIEFTSKVEIDKNINFEKECLENFLEWKNTNPKDIGTQCLKAIIHYEKKRKAIGIDIEALGNGSLMRALPCALINNVTGNLIQSRATHNNTKVDRIILRYHNLINKLIIGDDPKISSTIKLEPSGYIVNTYLNSLYWIKNTCTLEDAIVEAVNDGGDADTIAAITGSLAGAKYGFYSIPQRWIDSLSKDVKEKLDFYTEFISKYRNIYYK